MDKIETLLTTREAASRVGVSVQTISRWVAEEKLTPALKAPGIRGPLFFRVEDVDRVGAA
jgi:excisionase family DNA binding protein